MKPSYLVQIPVLSSIVLMGAEKANIFGDQRYSAIRPNIKTQDFFANFR